MKIIFLDIDGVLNSRQYDANREKAEGNIDETRLLLLKQLVERTAARIVLTSTWRCHWDPAGEHTNKIGQDLVAAFQKHGLYLYDKTPECNNNRPNEIHQWLERYQNIDAFVIIDDIKFGWDRLEPYVVKTDYHIGRGLEQEHIEKAIRILLKAE